MLNILSIIAELIGWLVLGFVSGLAVGVHLSAMLNRPYSPSAPCKDCGIPFGGVHRDNCGYASRTGMQ